MKKTPIKPSATGLSRRPLERFAALPRESRRRRAQRMTYSQQRIIFLDTNPMCARCMVNPSGEIHHMAGRIGDDLLDQRWWCAICRPCHEVITRNPALALAEGFSVSRIGRRPSP
jgi:hypothetical protein